MKKRILTILLVSVLVLGAAQGTVFAKSHNEGKYKVGFQSSYPSYGISGIMKVNEKVSVQAVAAPFGDVSTFALRGLYRLQDKEIWNVYGYGSVGLYEYNEGLADESITGFGIGVGIEYDWQERFGQDVPPLTSNIELGIGNVEFENYDYAEISIGLGTHYKF